MWYLQPQPLDILCSFEWWWGQYLYITVWPHYMKINLHLEWLLAGQLSYIAVTLSRLITALIISDGWCWSYKVTMTLCHCDTVTLWHMVSYHRKDLTITHTQLPRTLRRTCTLLTGSLSAGNTIRGMLMSLDLDIQQQCIHQYFFRSLIVQLTRDILDIPI